VPPPEPEAIEPKVGAESAAPAPKVEPNDEEAAAPNVDADAPKVDPPTLGADPKAGAAPKAEGDPNAGGDPKAGAAPNAVAGAVGFVGVLNPKPWEAMFDPAPENTPPPPPLGAGVPKIELPDEEAGAPKVEAPDPPPPKIPPALLPPPKVEVEEAPPKGFLFAFSEDAAPPRPPRKPPPPPPPNTLDEDDAGIEAPKTLEDDDAGVEAPKTEPEAGVEEAPKTEAVELGAPPNTELDPPNGEAEVVAVLLPAPKTEPELGAAAPPKTDDEEPPNADGADVAVEDPKTEPDPNPEAEVDVAPKGEAAELEGVDELNGDEEVVLVVATDPKTEGFEPPPKGEADDAGAGLPNMDDVEAAGFPNAEDPEDPKTD